MEARFSARLAKNLRSNLLVKVPDLQMSEERKSYFTHQLLNSRDLEDLRSLIKEINEKQVSEGLAPMLELDSWHSA